MAKTHEDFIPQARAYQATYDANGGTTRTDREINEDNLAVALFEAYKRGVKDERKRQAKNRARKVRLQGEPRALPDFTHAAKDCLTPRGCQGCR